jgi:hypothetical protein
MNTAIEIKNIKHFESMSEETNCFNATLHFNGKKIGTVSNRGTGGGDEFYGDNAAHAAADAWCKTNLPKWDCNGTQTETDIEIHVADLLAAHLMAKDFDRAIKTSILFTKPGERAIHQCRIKRAGKAVKPDAAVLAEFAKRHPDFTTLNSLPRAVAIALFAANA